MLKVKTTLKTEFTNSGQLKLWVMDQARGEGGLKNRRPSTTRLDPLLIPPLDSSEPVRYFCPQSLNETELKEVEDEGQDLFCNFLKDQIIKDSSIASDQALLSSLTGFKNSIWLKDGVALAVKANVFSKTTERKRLKENSMQVNLNMTQDQYRDFLSQFFCKDLMKIENILVLFFICADITSQALKESRELFQQYLDWSLSFIKHSVSLWVMEQGGWHVVLKAPIQPLIKMCLWAAVSALVLLVILRLNKLKSSCS